MTDSASPAAPPAPSTGAPATPARSEWRETLSFLLKLMIGVAILRSFIIAPFNIPSESMLPRLLIGDYLFVSKWNYGFSRYSLPFSLPLIPGHVLAKLPERGDIAVFKAPPGNSEDYIKRVIGLPGDTVQMRHGQLILNGTPVPKVRVADFTIAVSPTYTCAADYQDVDKGKPICRYAQYRETLPGGKSYNVLDRGQFPQDDTGVFAVPADHVFMMGDNRDDSADSRFPAVAGQGIGFVPVENLEGKAAFMFFSTDGTAWWLLPWTWFSAARWGRIGGSF